MDDSNWYDTSTTFSDCIFNIAGHQTDMCLRYDNMLFGRNPVTYHCPDLVRVSLWYNWPRRTLPTNGPKMKAIFEKVKTTEILYHKTAWTYSTATLVIVPHDMPYGENRRMTSLSHYDTLHHRHHHDTLHHRHHHRHHHHHHHHHHIIIVTTTAITITIATINAPCHPCSPNPAPFSRSSPRHRWHLP